MRKKKAQSDVGTSTQGDDKDDRVNSLFDIVERFLERMTLTQLLGLYLSIKSDIRR